MGPATRPRSTSCCAWGWSGVDGSRGRASRREPGRDGRAPAWAREGEGDGGRARQDGGGRPDVEAGHAGAGRGPRAVLAGGGEETAGGRPTRGRAGRRGGGRGGGG